MDQMDNQEYQQMPQEYINPEMTMEYAKTHTIWSPPFITASMIFALLSALSFLFIYLSVPLGAMAIVLALLSRGNTSLSARARRAIIISTAAMLISTGVTGYAFYKVRTDPELNRQFHEMFDYYLDYYGLRPAGEAAPDTPAAGESLIDFYLNRDENGKDQNPSAGSEPAAEQDEDPPHRFEDDLFTAGGDLI